MRAILLAAGRGSRMGEMTEVLPKCLTKLWGKTLLDWQMEAIREAGIGKIAVVTGYKAEEIKKRQPELTYFHNAKWAKTNMVSTLLEAETWLTAEQCLVSYTDIFYRAAAMKLLQNTTADIAITYYTSFWQLWQKRFADPLSDLESFKLDAESNLREIGIRANSAAEIEGQYMGLLRFTPNGWQTVKNFLMGNLPKPLEKMDMTGLFSFLIVQGIKIAAIPYRDLWLEVDRPEDLAIYEAMEQCI